MARLIGLLLALFLAGLVPDALAASPDQSATVGDVKSVGAIHSRSEFDTLARTTDAPYPLPHVLFVLDRQDGNRLYYVNSKR